MSQVTQVLVAPRYRHFVPEAPAFSVKVPGLKRAGPSGGLKQVQVYATEQFSGERSYMLDPNFAGSITGTISMYINGVYQSNNYGFFGTVIPIYDQYGEPMLDRNGEPIFIPIYEFQTFTYDPISNAVWLRDAATTPAIGSTIRFETVVAAAIEESVVIPMKKYTLQGVNPLDLTLVNPTDPTAPFFQGAYRCTLEVIRGPKHGILKITDDHFNFEYRPEVGFFGDDAFSYRVINCMGQESPVACVTLKVGQVVKK